MNNKGSNLILGICILLVLFSFAISLLTLSNVAQLRKAVDKVVKEQQSERAHFKEMKHESARGMMPEMRREEPESKMKDEWRHSLRAQEFRGEGEKGTMRAPQPGEPGHIPTELDLSLEKVVQKMVTDPEESTSAGEYSGDFPLKWKLESGVRVAYNQGQHFIAPDIIALGDGKYRMYFRVGQDGIGSAISRDGYNWQIEEGLRLANWFNQNGELVNASHPWAVKLPDTRIRLYYQAKVGEGERVPFVIMSAISNDGFQFSQEEGIRVEIGEESDIYDSGHGRTWQQPDGTFLMLFSGTLWDKPGPASLVLAKSKDGLDFEIINECIYEGGHDPTVAKLDNGWIVALFHPVGEAGILYMLKFSKDGINWTPAQELTVLGRDGSPITTGADIPGQRRRVDIGGDPGIFIFPDGTMRIYAIGDYGIVSFIPVEE